MRHTALVALGLLALTTIVATAQRTDSRAAESPDVALKTAINRELVDGDLAAAVKRYREIATRFRTAAPQVAAKALLQMAAVYEKLGSPYARKTYEEILRDFPDQRDAVATARAKLGGPSRQATNDMTLTTRRVLEIGQAWDRISPDGRYIARVDWNTNNLTLRELGTGKVRAVTFDGIVTGKPDEQYPLASAFSADGKQIAYQWYFEKPYRSVLRVIGTDDGAGKTARTVYDSPEVELTPTDWSPDGRWIAVLIRRTDRTKQVGVIGVGDGSLRVLKTVDWSGVGGLRFSPDSLRLAYHRAPQEGALERDVFVIAIDGSRETPVATSPGDDMVLEWTRDGQRLLVASDRSGSMSVWSVAASARTTTADSLLVKSDVGIISSVGPTRDGTLFYNMLPASPGIYTATFDTASGQLSSGSLQDLQQFRGFANFPEFLDDGRSLVYASHRDVSMVTGSVLTILAMDTGRVREVRPALSYGNFPHWFPDGRHVLLYGLDLQGRPGVFKIDATTGGVALTVPRETCNLPFVSSDGRSFFCHWTEQHQLREVDASTGAVLRTLPITDQPYATSPDGRYVVTSSLKIYTLATGESRDLISLSSPSSQVGNSFTIDWTPDSRSVVFYGRLNGNEGMWRVPIDGGQPKEIAVNVGRPILSWRINAKTGKVAFSTNGAGPRLEMWKMENFLPATVARR